jgi:hypothetical protein
MIFLQQVLVAMKNKRYHKTDYKFDAEVSNEIGKDNWYKKKDYWWMWKDYW